MPFAELKDNIKIHYHFRGKGVKSGALAAGAIQEDAAILAACEEEGYIPPGAQGGTKTSVSSMLAVNMPVLTYHYRGSGQSSIPQSLMEYSVEAYREDMRQLASQVGLDKFSLIGYSHGGYFAADYALAYPDQVSALVLVEPALFVDRAKLQERVKLARESGDDVIHVLMKQMVPEMAFNSKAYNDLVSAIKRNYPDPIGLAGEWYARSTNEIGEKELSQISVPTLVIGGESSWVRENIERTAKSIPGAQEVWLDGTHNLLEERPAEVSAAIESFLAETKSGAKAG